jgi:carbamoyl-phosphate synthase large subunit
MPPFALRELGFETIMVNSNPETVSTDYDTERQTLF